MAKGRLAVLLILALAMSQVGIKTLLLITLPIYLTFDLSLC